MNSKAIGSVLLIIGTTIGAGMLSLPLVVASCGFKVAILLLLLSWSVMYITALKLLNACAKYPVGVNFTSMLKDRTPKLYQAIFAVIYILLLYSLLSAYTSQGSSLVSLALPSGKANATNVAIPAIIFILIFGSLMYSYKVSDYANRIFVFLKFLFFILAIGGMFVYIQMDYLSNMPVSLSALVFAWPTLLPSFGFHNVIPVLYEYQNGDIKSIKKSILIGSLAVLIIYFIWIFLALSLIPQEGLHSYQSLFIGGNNTPNGFVNEIKSLSHSDMLEIGLNVFIHIAVITSFIGVGISLMHYIRDIFAKYSKNISNLELGFLCFIPPLIFTVFYPQGFILALQYAAIFAVIIFVYTPIFIGSKKTFELSAVNLYAGILGSLVIVSQIINLYFNINPFVG
ncbi:amino acid permease [Francisella adeliensis]|uniref:Amino acid transporter n=1 Tax=Francisella adeliensis TaxID=2007306 RepID=A0A2Z4XZX3_9GAMM|nr:aromatic amino acid transport family protein [Francisella adeliensis]AXA34340.1 amino acid transporter [Francisella adeliensis]MBK2084671.1 amino acid transporter [Francisella adeliensis]MBK2096180.1 amino acid transporter [Francisella adeliensis]QIW12587.1 amino acid transporter [Francisella adeliensis]QIW14460.1 amino acid transporter [Francisella adeliensis]